MTPVHIRYLISRELLDQLPRGGISYPPSRGGVGKAGQEKKEEDQGGRVMLWDNCINEVLVCHLTLFLHFMSLRSTMQSQNIIPVRSSLNRTACAILTPALIRTW
jgi:hypothetical protein